MRHPILKIWDLETIDKKSDSPILLRSTKIPHPAGPHPVSTVALSNALTHLAIGLANGTVLLYRQLDQSIFSGSTSLTALPKAKVVRESPTEPVTGLGFKEPTEENPNVYLFIVTTNNVLSYQASGRGSGGTPAVVDQVGAGLGCATLDWWSREMIVARDEAVYVVGAEGRGACYAYEGQIQRHQSSRSLLMAVIQEQSRRSTRTLTIWSSYPPRSRQLRPRLLRQ